MTLTDSVPASTENPRAQAARALYRAIKASGKEAVIIGYGSLSDGGEWRARIGNPSAADPEACEVKGLERVWTVADSCEQPANARIFMNRKTKERFMGYWASVGVGFSKSSMHATVSGKLSEDEFVKAIESEVSYFPDVVANADVIVNGKPLSQDSIAIIVKPFPKYRAIFQGEAIAAGSGRASRGMLARNGYVDKLLMPLRKLDESMRSRGGFNGLHQIMKLLGAGRPSVELPVHKGVQGAYVPPIGDFELVALPKPHERETRAGDVKAILDDLDPRFHDGVNELLTEGGLAKAQPKGMSVADYLGPVMMRLGGHGITSEAVDGLRQIVNADLESRRLPTANSAELAVGY